jgi:hypothetical protein
MEAQWIRDRALLRSLMTQSPQWSHPQYAQAAERSLSWVKTWKVRLKQAPRDDMQVLLSRSRAHHAPYHRWDLPVIQRLGEMREQPPEHLQRVPGPKTLVYFLRAVSLPARTRRRGAALESHRLARSYGNTAPSCRACRASISPWSRASRWRKSRLTDTGCHHRCRGSQRGRQTPTGGRSL